MKKDGFRLAIDDFGTGYSSLGYLKAFPIDCLKLDRLFIKDIIESPKDEAIAEAMVELCKKIGVNLIAEGVDTKEKLNKLQKLGCKIIQGFFVCFCFTFSPKMGGIRCHILFYSITVFIFSDKEGF